MRDVIRVRRLTSGRLAAGLVLAACALLAPTHLARPVLAQGADYLDKLDGAIEKERDYCDTLSGMPADMAEMTHNVTRKLPQATEEALAASERQMEKKWREERQFSEGLTRMLSQLQKEKDAALAKARARRDTDKGFATAKMQELRREATTIDARVAAIDTEIASLQSANDNLTSSGLLGGSVQAKGNNDRIAELRRERPTHLERKRSLAADFTHHAGEEARVESEYRASEADIKAKYDAHIAGLKTEEKRAREKYAETREAFAKISQERLIAKAAVASLDSCYAARLSEIRNAEKPKPATEEEKPATVANAPKTPEPATPPPAASPPSTASVTPAEGFPQVVGQLWPANARVACRNSNEPGPQTGILNFRFSPPNKVSFEGGHKGAKKSQLDNLVAELDGSGRFSKRQSDGFTSEMIDGRIEFLPGADGRVRPVGSGNMRFTMDLSPLAGMIGGAFVPGAGSEVKLTPEEREKMTVRCEGTWQLPAS